MSIWAKRAFFDHSFASCWDELIQLSSEGVADLMMVQSIEFKDGAATIAIYIRLPDDRLLAPGSPSLAAAGARRSPLTP
jgi:hypothetical protein